MDDNLLTVDELAEKLKVPKSWVYRQTRQTGTGAIPRIKVVKYLRFRFNEVMAWIEEKQNARRIQD